LKSNWIQKSLSTWLICTNCDVNIWCGFLLPAKRRCRLRISLRNPSWGKLTHSSTKAYANCSVVIGGFGRPRTRFPNCSQTCSIGFMSALHAGQSCNVSFPPRSQSRLRLSCLFTSDSPITSNLRDLSRVADSVSDSDLLFHLHLDAASLQFDQPTFLVI
jgi:hypothetical protein